MAIYAKQVNMTNREGSTWILYTEPNLQCVTRKWSVFYTTNCFWTVYAKKNCSTIREESLVHREYIGCSMIQ